MLNVDRAQSRLPAATLKAPRLKDKRVRRRLFHSTFNIQHLTFNILLFLLTLNLYANDLQVDKRTLSVDDSLTITITLNDAFTSLDNIPLPMQNLVIDGSPSVSSEFSWINGQSTRRKVFRYNVHPAGPGSALVGPVVLHAGDGQVETFAPIAIQVLPDRTVGSNDPVRILHELLATGRDPIFVVADANKTSAFVGEQVIVTWTIYNAANVQQHGLGDVPKFRDFWSEELDVRGETPQEIVVGGEPMQKLVIRRVALFPLRSGTLTVEPLSIEGQILKRADRGSPFGMFEGTLVDVHRHSAPLSIEARPVPPGPPVASVGDIALQCQTPLQKNGGPVAIDVQLRGHANLRAAPPPAFARPLEGSVQVAEGGVSVDRREEALMTRRWKFLIFPVSTGMFVIPPLVTTILTPSGERRELRCEQRTLLVEAAGAAANAPAVAPQPQDPRLEAARRSLPVAGALAVILIAIAVVSRRAQRSMRIRRETRSLLRATPAETRMAVDAWLAAREVDSSLLLREHSDQGDAYRALRSLLDAADQERLVVEPGEIRARVRELVVAMAGTTSQ
ncbi:MAG: hypothetical protein QOC81_1214 [Thermoanaerobaculia bacterium]|jgi:hypothetical protein|nr:hypothetical protein [Thermoanaerobaculia bacterium]